MTGVFYHRVIHGLGFFICFKIKILRAQNNKTRFFYVLYSDKTWVFDQSERAQGPIYILSCCAMLYDTKQFPVGIKDSTENLLNSSRNSFFSGPELL